MSRTLLHADADRLGRGRGAKRRFAGPGAGPAADAGLPANPAPCAPRPALQARPHRLALLSALLSVPALLLAAYTYYYTDTLTSINAGNWTTNGTVTATTNGLTGGSGGGSLISSVAVPGGNTAYEVRTTYRLTVSGGSYVTYLYATSNALLGATSTGTFYALELQPTFSGGNCTATLTLHKRVSSTLTTLGSAVVACYNGMATRAAIRPGVITVTFDGGHLLSQDTAISSGQPGVGARSTPAGNTVSKVELGPGDAIAPSPISTPDVTALPTSVEMQWPGVVDDANGAGTWLYQVFRGGTLIGSTRVPSFTDDALSSSTTYNYTVQAVDYHRNSSTATAFSIRTAPTNARDPRRVGVRPTGSYWGALGEQVDLQSGNVNYVLPVASARSRGWGAGFALSYNSQFWRQDSGGTWQLGRDVGFGHGWRLGAGSLTPSWSDTYTLHHWTFTDASGAEYRLDVESGGVWSSKDGVHVRYDEDAQRLTFRDGSFWVMGAVSSGIEDDAGTRHPTLMQDTNGNQIRVRYLKGRLSASPTDSSARITAVEDVRGTCVLDAFGACTGVYSTFSFVYDQTAFDPPEKLPHLVEITSRIGSGENVDFAYQDVTNLSSPFSSATFGAAKLLASATHTNTNLAHTFAYHSGSTGELTRVTLPYGGALGWEYQSFTYQNSRTVREVLRRTLTPSTGAPAQTYTFGHDAGDGARSLHILTTLADPSGTADQAWSFQSSGTSFDYALVTRHEQRALPGPAVKSRTNFTWAQSANGNPYISSTTAILDPGASFQSQRKVDQVVDDYGNVTQTRLYSLSNLTTPARTVTYTYLSTADYTSRHMRNRLASASVTDGSTTVPLTTNTYDQYGAMGDCPNRGSLVNRTGVRQHDTAAYGSGFAFRGNVAMVQTPGRTTCLSRDILGAATRTSDIDGHWSDRAYTATTNYAAPSTLTPNGTSALQTSLTYNAFLGVTGSTGPNTATTAGTYYPDGRPASATSAQGTLVDYAYQDGARTRTATLNGRRSRTTTDGLGRTIKVEALDTGSVVKSVVDTEYAPCACSPLGKVKRVSQPHLPGAGTVYWTTYNYDALGRTTSVALPNSAGTTSTLYEGSTVKVTGPSGKWKLYGTDAFGNLVKVTEPNPAGGADLITDHTYTLLNQLSTVTMTRGSTTQTRTFTYDPTTQRLASTTLPESGTTSYVYNRDGTLQRRTDALGQKIEYTYDTLGRTTIVKRFAAGGTERTCERVTYTYDTNPLDGTFTQNGQGRLTTAQYGGSACPAKSYAEMMSYTASGLLTKKRLRHTRSGASANLDATWNYDNEGRVTTMGYPVTGGGAFTYTYDSLGRPAGLTEQQDRVVEHVKDVTYGPASELTAIKYLNQKGATAGTDTYHAETRQYNPLVQLTRLTVPTVMDFEYRYSATQNDGQITSRKNFVGGEEITYQYDSLQRLTSAVTTGPEYGLSFSYDGFGNKTGQTVTKGSGPTLSLAIDQTTNRIIGQSYDANGNQTSLNGATLTYDVDNRLLSTSTNEQYGYAPDNRRLWRKKADGSEEVYLYGPGGQRLGTYTPNLSGSTLTFQPVHASVHFAGRAIRTEGAPFVADRLGSAVSGGRRYYPYGEEQPSATAQDRTKYATYHRDSTTGLDYADQRYYASQ